MADKRREQIERFKELLAYHDRQLSAAFYEFLKTQADSVPVDAVEQAMREGDVTGAAEIVAAALPAAEIDRLTLKLESAYRDGGFMMAEVQRLEFGFDVTNPRVTEWFSNYKMELIREINASTRAGVEEVLRDAVTRGIGPANAAVEVKNRIGLTARQQLTVDNYRNLIVTRDREALRRSLRDKRFDGTLARYFDGDADLSPDKIDSIVERYRQRLLRNRAIIIARTESTRALNAGNYAYFQQLIDRSEIRAEQVRRNWIYTKDNRVREEHVAIPGLNKEGVALNEAFKTPLGPLMFPGDPNGTAANTINCRCSVSYRILD
jgi:hypothetical protein